MFNKTIEQFMLTSAADHIKYISDGLDSLKKVSDLDERIRQKDRIQMGRERLLARLMAEDINSHERFRIGEPVICWHPGLYLSNGELKGRVVGFELDEQMKTLVKVIHDNGLFSRFAPYYVRHDIPREILSFSYWP